MVFMNHSEMRADGDAVRKEQLEKFVRIRLAGDFFNGAYSAGGPVKLYEIAVRYQTDEASLSNLLREFETLGMVTLSRNGSATFRSSNPKEMQDAYEIRAALEEIGGRSAASTLKGNTGPLRLALDAMRTAVRNLDLDSYAEHDVRFHRGILEASQNDVLLRVWDTLAFDLRIRAAIAKVTKNLLVVVGSHQPIIDALDRGQGREAGLLLRNHVETFLEFLKKAEADSGINRAVRKDLEAAKDIQTASLPQANVSIPGLSCETFYKPAQSIGGDYYDFLPLQDDCWGIAIGDVCGKGIGAALLMASLQASLRAQALHAHSDLSTLIADVDRLVLAGSPNHLYASLFYAEYDAATRVLRYVNAGHNAPMVVRWKNARCRVFRLEAGGRPLGLLEGSQFVSKAFQLETGDLLVAYTDGITESENPERELWGRQRLESLLRACHGVTPAQIIRRILDEVLAFANGVPQRDDITLVVVRVQDRAWFDGADFS